MKKKNWLMTIAFAVLALTIVSTCVIGSTYAKFTSNITGGSKVQAAGFLITGGSIEEISTFEMVAPGETKKTTVTVDYFSQVVTDITTGTVAITGTGVFDSTAWGQLLTAYKATTAGNADNTVTTSTTLADVYTVSLNNGSASSIATDFAAAVASASSGKVTATGAQLSAMAASERTAIQVSLDVKVTWVTLSDSFDTFIGNKIAELLQENTPVVSYITVSLPLIATQHTVAQG